MLHNILLATLLLLGVSGKPVTYNCNSNNIFKTVSAIGKASAIIKVDDWIDLNGMALILPSNITLVIDKGGFENGTITGTKTTLSVGQFQVFGDKLKINGTWCVDNAYAEWFGNCGQGDDTEYIQKCLNTFFQCKLLNRTYHVTTLDLPDNSKLEGSGQGRYQVSTIEQNESYKGDLITTGNKAYSGVIITGLRLTGGNGKNTAICVTVPNTRIDGVICDQYKGNGINLKDRAWGTTINNCGVYGNMSTAKNRTPLAAITINTGGGLITINNCQINYYEVGINIVKGVRITISGNNISECSMNHFKKPDSCITISGGGSIDIYDNYLENFCTGILLQSGKQISVHDNYINGLSVASFGIDIKGKVENLDISNNLIYMGYKGSWAIALRNSQINKQKIKVSANDLDEKKLYNMNGISITE